MHTALGARTWAPCRRCWRPCWCSWSPPRNAPTPPKLGLDMETNVFASAARSRADRTRRAPPPTRGRVLWAHSPAGAKRPKSLMGPRGAMGPQQTPALAHNALKPQAIARRRAFRKATHRFALDRRPRVSTHVCRARSRTITRDFVKHYSMLYGGCPGGRHGLTFGVAAPAFASHHITSTGTRPPASPRRPAPVPSPRPESP